MTRHPPFPERVELAPSLEISRIVTGLWQIADMERDGKTLDPDKAASAMAEYAKAGFDTFDMADHYGSAEIVTGRFLDLVRRGKVATPSGKPPAAFTKWCPEPGPMTAAIVRAGVQRSLDRMASDRIDLLQFHWWMFEHPAYLDAMAELAKLQGEGRIGHLGLTNFNSDHLRLLLKQGLRIASNQVCFSLLDRRAADEMSAVCREHGVKLLAYGTLGGGFLSERWLSKGEPPAPGIADWSKMKYKRFIDAIGYDRKTGGLDLKELKAKISARTAAVYFESPSYLGAIEAEGAAIARIARAAGAETIVGADPISLGVLKPPAEYGADIAVGPTQPLGVHMNCGGGVGGYIASRDEEKYVREYNGFLVSITGTSQPGEYGFSLASAHQTSYGMREAGKDWTGNSVYLWAIANAVYLSLLGPKGIQEVGELILQQAHYAAQSLARIRGVAIQFPKGFFKEFVVNFDKTGKTVARINKGLRRHGIFGGKDISREFPEFGQSALYCVTEVHSREDIDRLVAAVKEVAGK